MKLFLDDIRDPYSTTHVRLPLGPWLVVRNYDEFCKAINDEWRNNRCLPTFIAFDHDLAEIHYIDYKFGQITQEEYERVETKEKTGMDCAKWLIDFCLDNNLDLPDYLVHSMNPVGKKNIECLLENFNEKVGI
jgi:hypothetical protein